MSEPSEPDYCDLIDRIDFLNDRIAELVALHIEVVHCGGQCSAELLAKIERATQEEAGWTPNSLSSSNTQFDH